jgi:hypothetical protein
LLLSFDITKLRRLQILKHGECTLCDGQFSLVVFLGANPAFRFKSSLTNLIFLSHKTSFRWSLFSGKKNKILEFRAFRCNLG